jgi:hypothetical protein
MMTLISNRMHLDHYEGALPKTCRLCQEFLATHPLEQQANESYDVYLTWLALNQLPEHGPLTRYEAWLDDHDTYREDEAAKRDRAHRESFANWLIVRRRMEVTRRDKFFRCLRQQERRAQREAEHRARVRLVREGRVIDIDDETPYQRVDPDLLVGTTTELGAAEPIWWKPEWAWAPSEIEEIPMPMVLPSSQVMSVTLRRVRRRYANHERGTTMLLTLDQVVGLLGVSKQLIIRLTDQGKLTNLRPPKNGATKIFRMYDEAQIRAFAASPAGAAAMHQQQPATEPTPSQQQHPLPLPNPPHSPGVLGRIEAGVTELNEKFDKLNERLAKLWD